LRKSILALYLRGNHGPYNSRFSPIPAAIAPRLYQDFIVLRHCHPWFGFHGGFGHGTGALHLFILVIAIAIVICTVSILRGSDSEKK
jgi:glycerol-3-phosphate acyltransferase PlsY